MDRRSVRGRRGRRKALGAPAVSRWGADLLVSNFVERVALRWWLFALCGAVVLLIVCTVQLVRTWRIANANPINMIKTE
ncbi:hypothetical protein [Alistipes sp. CAG:29]|uniref:hypothetical protein n=1 Tax=Alistipes sp. CAG:29 TaxID=1262694 RepID=UPI0025866834|nr:hypothetical protein [Alistipes sp. CAG:29]